MMKTERQTTDRTGNTRAFHRVAALFAGALILPMLATAQGPERDEGQRPPPERPDPAEMAKRIMADFDANQDGSLSLEELIASLRAMEKRHPHGPPPGGPGGSNSEGGRPPRPDLDN